MRGSQPGTVGHDAAPLRAVMSDVFAVPAVDQRTHRQAEQQAGPAMTPGCTKAGGLRDRRGRPQVRLTSCVWPRLAGAGKVNVPPHCLDHFSTVATSNKRDRLKLPSMSRPPTGPTSVASFEHGLARNGTVLASHLASLPVQTKPPSGNSKPARTCRKQPARL
jgi:hypothetical protein